MSTHLKAVFFVQRLPGQAIHARNLQRLALADPDLDIDWVPLRSDRTAVYRAREVQATLVRARADVVFFNTAMAAAALARGWRRFPTTISMGSLPAAFGTGPLAALKDGAHARAIRQATSLVPWTDWAAGQLESRYGLSPEAVEVVPPGVDLELWRPAASAPPPRPRPRVLCVAGRFMDRGGDTLLDWFLARGRRHCHLTIVSAAPEALAAREAGAEVHDDLGPNSIVLRRLYRESDLFVLPSHIDDFSIPVVEALATGLPVVTTSVGCLPEIVTDGVNGRLIRRDDPTALGAAVEGLLADDAGRRALSTAARRTAEQRFDADRNARRLLDIVKGSAGPKRSVVASLQVAR